MIRSARFFLISSALFAMSSFSLGAGSQNEATTDGVWRAEGYGLLRVVQSGDCSLNGVRLNPSYFRQPCGTWNKSSRKAPILRASATVIPGSRPSPSGARPKGSWLSERETE